MTTFLLTATSNIVDNIENYSRMEHEKFTRRLYHRFRDNEQVISYRLFDTKIEINSLDDLLQLVKDSGGEIIINTKEDIPEIEIYNDYRE